MVEIEAMSIRELFRELNVSEKMLVASKKALQETQNAYGKARHDLSDIVRPERIDDACERWLLAEKDAITAATKEYEDVMMRFNLVGREIDTRRMELDQEKLKQGIT